MIADLVFSDAKAYINGSIVDCSIAIEDGRILKIGRQPNMPQSDKRTNLKGLLVLPGLIDTHVHLRDEGKSRKEDFTTGTSAAAAGGITTVLDMPNNEPVTMSSFNLANRMDLAKDKTLVNVGFFSEFPKELSEIDSITETGAVAFKLFMTEQIGGLDINDDRRLEEAFEVTKNAKRLVATHAEDRNILDSAKEKLQRLGHDDIEAYLKVHSEKAEVYAITRLLALTEKADERIHFCHVTTAEGLQKIREAKQKEIKATCEVTPHNLLLTDIDLRRIGSYALTMPPLRSKRDIEALWEAIRNGDIDIIASDHAPHLTKEKETEDVWQTKVGIAGLETTIPLLLTQINKGLLSVSDLVRLMAENPARIFHLEDRGAVTSGYYADLTVIDLHRKGRIEAANFYSKAKYSPFDGWDIEGMPVKTIVKGEIVMDEGDIISKRPVGGIVRGE